MTSNRPVLEEPQIGSAGIELAEGRRPHVLRVAAVQCEYVPGETIGRRIERIRKLVLDADDCDLVVLPELWAHGGFNYDEWEATAEPLDGEVFTAMAELAKNQRIWLHAGSIIERRGTHPVEFANTSAVFDPSGTRQGVYRKIHRFGFSDGEPRLLTPGEDVVTMSMAAPLGDSFRVGLSTCYDLRFPELYRQLLDAGAEVNLVPAAWPASRAAHWTTLGIARAIENQTAVIQCNLAGRDGATVLAGASQIIAPGGNVLALAGSEEEVIIAEVDLQALRALRSSFPVLQDRRLPST